MVAVQIEHVSIIIDKPFSDVAAALESQLGRFDATVYEELRNGDDPDAVRSRLQKMEGSSGLMLFWTSNHGHLLRLVSQTKAAIQYVVGNPLIAIQMTQHDIRAALYAPLRILIYEDEPNRTCVEYDLPSTLFGQFGNAKVTEVALQLDEKLARLIASAT
jgi:uncharacterized protein (DUF302 family)